MKPKISVILNTLNEEHNIRNCLECVKWADEIIVVDMYSDDRTARIAREYTDKVFLHKRMGFADPARQFALEQTSGDWILMVDADELITPALRDRLIDIALHDSFDVVWLSFHYYFFGYPSKGNGWGPFQGWCPRFFKRGFLRYTSDIHNFHRVDPTARTCRLRGDSCAIIHFHCVSVGQCFDKLNRYSTIEAEQAFAAGRSLSNIRLLYAMAKEFAWRFFWKKGYKDGGKGLALLLAIMTYRVLIALKLRVMQYYNSQEPDAAVQREYDAIAARIIDAYAERVEEPARCDIDTPAKVYVVSVNWNRWQDTIECLESVLRSDYPNFQMIVCDNGSIDGSIERIRKWAAGNILIDLPDSNPLKRLSFPPLPKPVPLVQYDAAQAERGGEPGDSNARVILIETGRNLGFAGGNNACLRYILARGDAGYIWLLNNDTVVDPAAMKRLVEQMAARPEVGMCGSKMLRYKKPDKVMAMGGATYSKWLGVSRHIGTELSPDSPIDRESVERKLGHVAGASMMISRNFLEDIGLMEERYFLYFEEIDWAVRARGHYKLAYAPESIIYHKQGESTRLDSSPKPNLAAINYLIGNRLIFTRKFYPWALPTVYLGLTITLLNRIRRGQWRGLGSILRTILMGGQ